MVPLRDFVGSLLLLRLAMVDQDDTPANVIDCGTWRGGLSSAILKFSPKVENTSFHFYDSFAGLPPPKESDGIPARLWARDTLHKRYFNNCYASLDDFKRNIAFSRRGKNVSVHPGKLSDTLSASSVDNIVFARIDVDWYDSTLEALSFVWPRMRPGGVIVLDDYLHWEGCRRAVYQFLVDNNAFEPIQSLRWTSVHYIIKDFNPNAYTGFSSTGRQLEALEKR